MKTSDPTMTVLELKPLKVILELKGNMVTQKTWFCCSSCTIFCETRSQLLTHEKMEHSTGLNSKGALKIL
jgi:hypothetical protein